MPTYPVDPKKQKTKSSCGPRKKDINHDYGVDLKTEDTEVDSTLSIVSGKAISHDTSNGYVSFADKNVKLSKREIECIAYVLKGKTAKETARELNISNRTVEVHLEKARIKLNCKNKIELISKFVNLNLILSHTTFK